MSAVSHDDAWQEQLSILQDQHSQAVLIEAKAEQTFIVDMDGLLALLKDCKQHLQMHMLLDVCGVDYLHYAKEQWITTYATAEGYSRGPEGFNESVMPDGLGRFACVYHLLSLHYKQRLRVKVFLDKSMTLPSVVPLWPSANWYEREAYDLFGFVFLGHPGLARILTDYAFIGYPFRKDFPVSGYNEMCYSAEQERCIYEPSTIEPRTTVPKVIRSYDNRYADKDSQEDGDE